MSRFVRLPANIAFSSFRPHPSHPDRDQFDILIDGAVVHTMDVDFSNSFGSGQEEFTYRDAHMRAEQWLLERHQLPPKPMPAAA